MNSLEQELEYHTRRGDLTRVQEIIEANPSLLDRPVTYDGRPALMIASKWGHLDIVEYLLNKGANVDARNEDGDTSLLCAAAESNCDIIQFLIGRNADIDAQNIDGNSAIILASYYGHEECCMILLSAGCNPTLRDTSGSSALDVAKQKSHTSLVELLEYSVNNNSHIPRSSL